MRSCVGCGANSSFAAFALTSRTRRGSQVLSVTPAAPNKRERRMTAMLPVVSFLRNAIGLLMTFLFPSWYGPATKYRPEDHYMRGPGPKSRAKHSSDRG